MFDVKSQREAAKKFLMQAAKAQDAGEPYKSLDYMANEEQINTVQALRVFGHVVVDDVTDVMAVTTEGRLFAGVRMADTPDLGQNRIQELKGTVREGELAARYVDSKVGGCERLIKEGADDPEGLRKMARVLGELAREFRQDFHIPLVTIDGFVKPYNDDNDTGIKHGANMRLFFADVHERNVRAGWWTDLETGEPKKRSPGELMVLMVTEMAEAYDAWLTDEQDDKLPEHPGVGVEMGDLIIRVADFCGAAMAGRIIRGDPADNPGDKMFREIVDVATRYESIRKTPQAVGQPEHADFLPPMDIAVMIDEKLAFNASREDHKIENRLKEDGKRT